MEIGQYLPFHDISDVELVSVINNDNQYYSLNALNTLIFNNGNDNNQDIRTVEYLSEPVINDPICEYIFSDESQNQLFPNNSLKLLAYNISSVPQYLDSLYDQCLKGFSVSLDVIGLCETRLNDNICNLYQLDSYLPHFQNKSTQSGGLAIYLHNKFQGVVIDNVSMQLPYIETLFIKIFQPITFLVGMMYRPPNSSFNHFLESMEEILQTISNLRLKCYVMGDFNINLLHSNDNSTNYINLFQTYNFAQTITKPTRVTSRSATLIDHIWTNDMQHYIRSGILYNSISDHFPVLSSFSAFHQCNNSFIRISRRIYNRNNIDDFKEDLKNFDWISELAYAEGIENLFTSYMEKFKSFYNNNFPLKSFSIKEKHYGKPYITPGIIKSIKHRNKLQKLYAKWPLTYETTFKKYRNMLTTVIRKAKQDYCKSKLIDQQGNTKKTWETLHSLMG